MLQSQKFDQTNGYTIYIRPDTFFKRGSYINKLLSKCNYPHSVSICANHFHRQLLISDFRLIRRFSFSVTRLKCVQYVETVDPNALNPVTP